MTRLWKPHIGRADVYIPHPAPTAVLEDDNAKMGLWSVIKTLVVPAIISLLLYLIISYFIVPVWRRYKGRYSQYIPLDRLSTGTTTFRERIQRTMARYMVPSTWRSQFSGERFTISAQDGNDSDFDENEGEELFEVDANRREAISLDARRGRDEDGARLSRDLEEGFKDDSEEEEEEDADEDERLGRLQSR